MVTVHVMMDTETWGTIPGSALRSIAAVTFDPFGGDDFQEQVFSCNVDRASCEQAGLTIDPATEAWWARQSVEAQEALLVDPWDLRYAAFSFEAWWLAQRATHLWCNGACFDEPIMRVALTTVGKSAPWKYWNVRDTRTIWDIAGVDPKSVPREGVAHNALHDARHQARCVRVAYSRLGMRPPFMVRPMNLDTADLRPGHITDGR